MFFKSNRDYIYIYIVLYYNSFVINFYLDSIWSENMSYMISIFLENTKYYSWFKNDLWIFPVCLKVISFLIVGYTSLSLFLGLGLSTILFHPIKYIYLCWDSGCVHFSYVFLTSIKCIYFENYIMKMYTWKCKNIHFAQNFLFVE